MKIFNSGRKWADGKEPVLSPSPLFIWKENLFQISPMLNCSKLGHLPFLDQSPAKLSRLSLAWHPLGGTPPCMNRIRVYQPESLANGCSTQFSKDLKWSEIAKTSKWGGVIAQLYRKPIRRGMSHNSSYFTQYRAHIQCYLIVWMGEWDRERLLPAQGHITVWLVEQNWESSPTWWVSRPRFFQLFCKGCFCLVPIVWPDSVH